MRKVIVLFLSCQVASFAFGTSSDHLRILRSKYPYGLLGDDYGILTVSDLALNACHVKPEPFVPGNFTPYEYWLCFENKSISVACEDRGFLEEEGAVGRVAVRVHEQQTAYRFFGPRPSPLRACKRYVRELKSLMHGTLHSCISASYIGKDEETKGGEIERLGILHRFKTRKGCDGEDCEFTEKTRKELCPDLKSS